MGIEVVSRDGHWFVRKPDGEETAYPDRDAAVLAANELTSDGIKVVHERSAHVRAELKFK